MEKIFLSSLPMQKDRSFLRRQDGNMAIIEGSSTEPNGL